MCIRDSIHDLLSTFTRRCFIEFDVRVARDTGNRHCRYQLCMETLCPESNRRRNALIINDHRVDDTCHYCQFLASEIGDNRDPSSHEQFVGSATNTDDIYSLGSCANCIVFKLICSVANNFAKNGIMSMYTDVDMVLLQRAEICLGHYICGTPNKTSERLELMFSPVTSPSEHLMPPKINGTGSASQPIWVRCMTSVIPLSMFVATTSFRSRSSSRFAGSMILSQVHASSLS